jgi:hypothetical protein
VVKGNDELLQNDNGHLYIKRKVQHDDDWHIDETG